MSAAGLWPKAKFWWKDDAIALQAHRSHGERLVRLFDRHSDLAVTFWTKLAVVVPIVRAADPTIVQVGVQLEESVLFRNWKAREEAIADGESGHSSRPWEDYRKGWEKAMSEFASASIEVFPSFEVAAKKLGLYVSRKGGM